MIEETAVRVEISAARFASQSIFDILRLTVQAMSSQNYGQQSLNALNRQERPLASVDVNKKTLPYIRRQLKQLPCRLKYCAYSCRFCQGQGSFYVQKRGGNGAAA